MSVILRYVLILFLLLAGLTIYLVLRHTSSPFYNLAVQLGWSESLDSVRNVMSPIHMPVWFVYSLPDGLWMFSFVLFMMAVWDFRFSGTAKIWILTSVCLGLSFEICQAFIKGMGAFDWMDMIFLSAGAFIPVLLFSKHKSYETIH